MLALIRKASDDEYYSFKPIDKIEDILNIAPKVIIKRNWLKNRIKYDPYLQFFEGVKKEDIPFFNEAEIEIIIDSYIE